MGQTAIGSRNHIPCIDDSETGTSDYRLRAEEVEE